MSLKVFLDTNIIIAMMDSSDAHHEDCSRLLNWAGDQHDVVEFLVSSTLDYDLESAAPTLAATRKRWIADQGLTSAPGPFTLGVSRLGADVLVSEDDGAAIKRLVDLLVDSDSKRSRRQGGDVRDAAGQQPNPDRRKSLDLHHYHAAIIHGADLFVTLDRKRTLGRLRKAEPGHLPVPIVSPTEAVDECARRLGVPAQRWAPRRSQCSPSGNVRNSDSAD